MSTPRNWVVSIAIGALTLGCLICSIANINLEPIHWLVFNLLWLNWPTWLAILLLGGGGIVAIVVGSSDYEPKVWLIVGGIVAILLLLPFWWWADDTFGRAVQNDLRPEFVSANPETGLRFYALEVAKNQAKNKLSDPRSEMGDADPLYLNNEPLYTAPIQPNNYTDQVAGPMKGLLVINQTTGASQLINQPFKCGENMLWGNNVKVQLNQRKWDAVYGDVYYLPDGDKWDLVAPYLTFHFVFPRYIPQWGGVMVVHGDCSIEDLSPATAMADPRFASQRLYPLELIDFQMKTVGYDQGGLGNILFTHQGQIEIPETGSTNTMPYYMQTDWGYQWMYSVEPFGNSKGLYRSYWFDVHTGHARVVNADPGLIGPNAAIGVVQAKTQIAWESYRAIEPRPVYKIKNSYWMYSVTDTNGNEITMTVLVNAKTLEVIHLCTLESVQAWEAGSGGNDSIPCGQSGTNTTSVSGNILDWSQYSNSDLFRFITEIGQELQKRGK